MHTNWKEFPKLLKKRNSLFKEKNQFVLLEMTRILKDLEEWESYAWLQRMMLIVFQMIFVPLDQNMIEKRRKWRTTIFHGFQRTF